MIIRTPKPRIDEYYQKTSLNQSSIKTIIEGGVQCYVDQAAGLLSTEEQYYYEEKEHYLIGSAVDHYVSMGEQSYLDNYYFSNVPKPAPGVMSVIKCAYDAIGSKVYDLNFYDIKKDIQDSCTLNNFYPNWNKGKPAEEDSRVNKVYNDPNAQRYFDDLKEAKGKQILSESQNLIINQIIGNFTSHPRVAPLFRDATDTDVIYQLPIYFTYRGVYCKVLPDLIRVHHGLKRIYIIDVKTFGGYLANFGFGIKRRRYDLQGAFYTLGVNSPEGRKTISEVVGRDCSEYVIAPFANIAESTKSPKTPMIFVYSDDLMKIGKEGNGQIGEERILGYDQGITLFQLWSDNSFDMDNVVNDVFGNGIVQVTEHYEFHKKF